MELAKVFRERRVNYFSYFSSQLKHSVTVTFIIETNCIFIQWTSRLLYFASCNLNVVPATLRTLIPDFYREEREGRKDGPSLKALPFEAY